METFLAIALMFFGIIALTIGINIFRTPNHIYQRNHEITKQINAGELLDSDLVKNEITYDQRTGQLCLSQKLAKKAIIEPDYGE